MVSHQSTPKPTRTPQSHKDRNARVHKKYLAALARLELPSIAQVRDCARAMHATWHSRAPFSTNKALLARLDNLRSDLQHHAINEHDHQAAKKKLRALIRGQIARLDKGKARKGKREVCDFFERELEEMKRVNEKVFYCLQSKGLELLLKFEALEGETKKVRRLDGLEEGGA